MNTSLRFNITLPHHLGMKLKASKNHSRLIAESLELKFAMDETNRLERELAKGYQDRAKSDAILNKEFDATIGDGL
ncbi:MAG: hypothetical protein ABIV43_03010 [Candidatus Saccharimonadales bacterium]